MSASFSEVRHQGSCAVCLGLKGARSRYRRLYGICHPAIVFQDPVVKAICVANWDTGGDGELSYDEAAAVTNLGDAFSGNKEIRTFNELQYFTGINTVDNEAFRGCGGLNKIVLPESVSCIGSYSFAEAGQLRGIFDKIQNASIERRIENNAFENSLLSGVLYLKGFSTIGDYAFIGTDVRSISSIVDFEADCLIGAYAFEGCSLEAFEFFPLDPICRIDIGERAFTGGSLSHFALYNGPVVNIGDGAFAECRSLDDVNLGRVETIGEEAFYGCSSLKSIQEGEGVSIEDFDSLTSIGHGAFADCSALTTMYIPATITDIGEAAFSGCSSLMSFSGGLATSDGLFLILSGGLRGVAWGALEGHVIIPEGVTSLNRTFSYSDITSISLPESMEMIDDGAFYGCESLTSIDIKSNYISAQAFRCCSALRSITIENTCVILSNAFSDCTGLTSVTFLATEPGLLVERDAFENTNNCPIYVPAGSVDAYKAAESWSRYADRIQAIPESMI